MPKSVNKVILVGNVGKRPEIKYTPSGTPVATLSFATNERFKNKGGEWQERTEWHNIIAWQRLAEIVGEYVDKGKKLYVEGRLHTSSWEDKQSGERKYRTEIVAHEILLLGDSNGTREEQHNGRAQPDYHASSEITDEDIPF
jgi:single-strand DNA-binding protein